MVNQIPLVRKSSLLSAEVIFNLLSGLRYCGYLIPVLLQLDLSLSDIFHCITDQLS